MTFVQTMEHVFTNVQDKIYLPQRGDGKPRELRLQLNASRHSRNRGGPVKRKWTRRKNEECGKWQLFTLL